MSSRSWNLLCSMPLKILCKAEKEVEGRRLKNSQSKCVYSEAKRS